MESKTCGECQHWHPFTSDGVKKGNCDIYYCTKVITATCNGFLPFSKPTNGDKIRQMSNEELAVMFRMDIKQCPPGECHDDGCIECWLAWLNAPAEGEGEDD